MVRLLHSHSPSTEPRHRDQNPPSSHKWCSPSSSYTFHILLLPTASLSNQLDICFSSPFLENGLLLCFQAVLSGTCESLFIDSLQTRHSLWGSKSGSTLWATIGDLSVLFAHSMGVLHWKEKLCAGHFHMDNIHGTKCHSFINIKCLMTNCIWKIRTGEEKPHLGLINNVNDFKDPLLGQKLFSLTVHTFSCVNPLRVRLQQQNYESFQDRIL